MAERQTAIVGIGTEYFRSLTQVHAAEDLLGDRYPLAVRPRTLAIRLTDFDGTMYDYELPFSESIMGRRIERLEHLLGPDELVQWRLHDAPLFVTSAPRVTEVLIDAALRVARRSMTPCRSASCRLDASKPESIALPELGEFSSRYC
jgi:aminoglycoside 3-N-acetyltransferase